MRDEIKYKKARQQKVREFVDGDGDVYFKPGERSFMSFGKNKRGERKMQVAFDERHMEAVGKEGRDRIREALDKADRREGVGFIDGGKAMRLERIRYAKQKADDYEAKKNKSYDAGETTGVSFKVFDKFSTADNAVRFTVFGLSLVFVVLLFRFLFLPLFLI